MISNKLLFFLQFVVSNGKNIYVLKLTVFVHCRLKALVESASPTLVAMSFVYGTPSLEVPLGFAGVDAIPVDAPLEETRTACLGGKTYTTLRQLTIKNKLSDVL